MSAFFVGLVRSLALRPLEPLVDSLGHHALQTDQGQPVAHEQGEKDEHAESGQNDHDGQEESEEFHSALR